MVTAINVNNSEPNAAIGADDRVDMDIETRDDEDDEMGVDVEGELECMEAGMSASAAPARTQQYYSIAHDDILSNNVVYLHLDLEYDMFAGILQLSVLFMDHTFQTIGTFNVYVKPPDYANWNDDVKGYLTV